MRFIIWDPKDGRPTRGDDGTITTSGLVGEITEDNAFLTAYAEWPTSKRPRELEVNESILDVGFSLSGSKGRYDVYRVR